MDRSLFDLLLSPTRAKCPAGQRKVANRNTPMRTTFGPTRPFFCSCPSCTVHGSGKGKRAQCWLDCRCAQASTASSQLSHRKMLKRPGSCWGRATQRRLLKSSSWPPLLPSKRSLHWRPSSAAPLRPRTCSLFRAAKKATTPVRGLDTQRPPIHVLAVRPVRSRGWIGAARECAALGTPADRALLLASSHGACKANETIARVRFAESVGSRLGKLLTESIAGPA